MVVLKHTSLTKFCSIPLVPLRENTLEELDLSFKGIGVPGAIVVGSLLPVATALTSLNLRSNLLDAESVEHLCNGLQNNESLQSLDLSDNHLGASVLGQILMRWSGQPGKLAVII